MPKWLDFPDRHHADTGGLGLLNGFVHGKNANQLAHAAVAVDHRGDRRFKYHLRLGLHMDGALLNALVVADHPLHAMAFNAIQILQQQHVPNGMALLLRKAEAAEHIPTELIQGFITPFYIAHGRSSLFGILIFILVRLIFQDDYTMTAAKCKGELHVCKAERIKVGDRDRCIFSRRPTYNDKGLNLQRIFYSVSAISH